MANLVNTKKLDKIRDNYTSVWEWMKDKAKWEHMSLGTVLNCYEGYIDELIEKEEAV